MNVSIMYILFIFNYSEKIIELSPLTQACDLSLGVDKNHENKMSIWYNVKYYHNSTAPHKKITLEIECRF